VGHRRVTTPLLLLLLVVVVAVVGPLLLCCCIVHDALGNLCSRAPALRQHLQGIGVVVWGGGGRGGGHHTRQTLDQVSEQYTLATPCMQRAEYTRLYKTKYRST
jgi:hypothetical protein